MAVPMGMSLCNMLNRAATVRKRLPVKSIDMLVNHSLTVAALIGGVARD